MTDVLFRGQMNVRILGLLVVLLGAIHAFGQHQLAQSVPHSESCSLKPDQLEAILTLPVLKFDQDQYGWRDLQNRGCELTAAMLIDTYVVDSPAEMRMIDRESLYFHAGQLYALAGLRKLAVRRILRSLNLHEGANEDLAWNTYVLATVAYLQGDREELAHQRQLLASAKPTHENKINLGVVDGLAKCFDRSYNDAYSSSCRAATK